MCTTLCVTDTTTKHIGCSHLTTTCHVIWLRDTRHTSNYSKTIAINLVTLCRVHFQRSLRGKYTTTHITLKCIYTITANLWHLFRLLWLWLPCNLLSWRLWTDTSDDWSIWTLSYTRRVSNWHILLLTIRPLPHKRTCVSITIYLWYDWIDSVQNIKMWTSWQKTDITWVTVRVIPVGKPTIQRASVHKDSHLIHVCKCSQMPLVHP